MADEYDGGVTPDGITPDMVRAAEKRAAAIAADRGSPPVADEVTAADAAEPVVKARKQTTRNK